MLLEAGADAEHTCYGKTMYEWAVKEQRLQVVTYLRQHGFRPKGQPPNAK